MIAGSRDKSILSLGRNCQADLRTSAPFASPPLLLLVIPPSRKGTAWGGYTVALHTGELRSSLPYIGTPLWESVHISFLPGGGGWGEKSTPP